MPKGKRVAPQGPFARGQNGFKYQSLMIGDLNVRLCEHTVVIEGVVLSPLEVITLRNNLTNWSNARRSREQDRAKARGCVGQEAE